MSVSCAWSSSKMVQHCVASLLGLSVRMDEFSPGDRGRIRVLKRLTVSRRWGLRVREVRVSCISSVCGLLKKRSDCTILCRNTFHGIICYLTVRCVPAVLA